MTMTAAAAKRMVKTFKNANVEMSAEDKRQYTLATGTVVPVEMTTEEALTAALDAVDNHMVTTHGDIDSGERDDCYGCMRVGENWRAAYEANN